MLFLLVKATAKGIWGYLQISVRSTVDFRSWMTMAMDDRGLGRALPLQKHCLLHRTGLSMAGRAMAFPCPDERNTFIRTAFPYKWIQINGAANWGIVM
jgi:hypothetical protein